MTLLDAVLFAPVAMLIALTPGPNNFCAMNNGIRHGIGTAVLATTGRVVAFAIFLSISAIGLGAMLLASETAFTAIKWVGALYLLYLGISAWRSREFNGLELDGAVPAVQPQRRIGRLMLQEFLIGISNPKAILLFAAVFPQFIKPGQPAIEQFVYLGATYLLAEYAASLVYALFGRQIRRFIRTSRGAQRLNRTTGAFFMGAGGLLIGTTQH
ncbi:threonine/homoserine/homoserine lactone efflux protein [Pseudomonas sp. BIGb0408]|uniref:Threonine/homoserine/homoserine lactone efflux protein n=1 Tax=Phytopseudomonas flavescens TaxID=29435 RepID=A0A7Z0BMK1_9GAMM|nr:MULTISPECIES: LysE family transporter [Pseudomonas]MCW2292883.1 threonine/homoserine/homoserine lactone efflux protein [Pseudomonas sp. BIGb0408]NYH72547.1 threonine/homoserine/homoserine lactone efflux protein [Pseudomonas flavescens]